MEKQSNAGYNDKEIKKCKQNLNDSVVVIN